MIESKQNGLSLSQRLCWAVYENVVHLVSSSRIRLFGGFTQGKLTEVLLLGRRGVADFCGMHYNSWVEMPVLALQMQSTATGLPTWQFLLAIAIAPVATIVVLMWTWSMNNRRAEQVKTELSKSISDLGARVTELKADLSDQLNKTGGRVIELKTDLNGQMAMLKTDLTSQAAQLRSDVSAMKADIKDWVKTEMEAGFSKLEVQNVRNQNELSKIIESSRRSAAGG